MSSTAWNEERIRRQLAEQPRGPWTTEQISEALNGRQIPPLNENQAEALWRLVDRGEVVFTDDRRFVFAQEVLI